MELNIVFKSKAEQMFLQRFCYMKGANKCLILIYMGECVLHILAFFSYFKFVHISL